MTDYEPLYVGGKRDSARRFVAPDGKIISRREHIKRTEGHSPEEKAYKRYKSGKSKKGVTARQYEKRQETKERKKRYKEKRPPTRGETLPEKTLLPPHAERRGYLQLQGKYGFYNPEMRLYSTPIGFSPAQRNKDNYFIAHKQAVDHAAASLESYGWILDGVIWEQWLHW